MSRRKARLLSLRTCQSLVHLAHTDASLLAPVSVSPLSSLLYSQSPPYSRPSNYSFYARTNSLAVKNFIDTGAGVVDEDYRGPLKVLLFNHSEVDFQVSEGDRIAQLVLEKIYTPPVIEVESLNETERGVGGFGSTGK